MVSDKGPYSGCSCLTMDDLRELPAGGGAEPAQSLASPLRMTYPSTRPAVPERWKFIAESEAPARVEPPWLQPTVQGLAELLMLPPGWDSYGALAVDPTHVEAALRVLCLVMREDTPKPSIGPTNRGGVQVEWHERGIDLELETLSAHRLRVSYEDSTTGTDWDREVGADLTPLIECITCLSSR